MSAHTPGPWWVDRHGAVVARVDGDARQVAMACGEAPMHDDRSAEPPDTGVVQSANARLIAAAPDLLEALRFLLREEPNIYEGRLEASLYVTVDALEFARAAITKAEGKS